MYCKLGAVIESLYVIIKRALEI